MSTTPLHDQVNQYIAAHSTGQRIEGDTFTPQQVLGQLKCGNAAYSSGDAASLLVDHLGPHVTESHRQAAATHQTPIATVLTCSDSRVSPELLFGCGIGALFVVRNAGNIVSTEALASIEFGCVALATPLLVIMGHEGCAAVTNTVHAVQQSGVDSAEMKLRLGGTAAHISSDPVPKYVAEVLGRITPAAVDAIRACTGSSAEEVVEDAVMRNARLSRDILLYRSDAITQRLAQQPGNGFKVMVAKHSVSTGLVDFFDE